VTFALKRLTKDGLATLTSDGRIRLSSQGREIAERTIVRHDLIERMLSEIFGMPLRGHPKPANEGHLKTGQRE
jgi:DtxR family transcriptional regulator, Mn-dependent transcriptional regulator